MCGYQPPLLPIPNGSHQGLSETWEPTPSTDANLRASNEQQLLPRHQAAN